MQAELVIWRSIKAAEGLAKTRKCSFLFLVFRDVVPFPTGDGGRGDEGMG